MLTRAHTQELSTTASESQTQQAQALTLHPSPLNLHHACTQHSGRGTQVEAFGALAIRLRGLLRESAARIDALEVCLIGVDPDPRSHEHGR